MYKYIAYILTAGAMNQKYTHTNTFIRTKNESENRIRKANVEEEEEAKKKNNRCSHPIDNRACLKIQF